MDAGSGLEEEVVELETRNGTGPSGSGTGLFALIVFLVIWLARLALLGIIAIIRAYFPSASIRSILTSSPRKTTKGSSSKGKTFMADHIEKHWWRYLLLYSLVWIFTSSYRFNNVPDTNPFGDFIAGMIWPIYWTTRIALWLTLPW